MCKVEKPVLTVPSWIIPGTYAENLRFLNDKKEIRGVELLFFLYDDAIKKQLDLEWEEICRYRERFIFTAHLPELLLPSHDELIARFSSIVRHFIIHPSIDNIEDQVRLLSGWKDKYGATFLAENTQSGFLKQLLSKMGTAIDLCMDTGHLLLEGKNPAEFFANYRERIGEIHLHGVDHEKAVIDGKLADHRRLSGKEPWLLELFPLLVDYNGILNLEMFLWEEAAASMKNLPY